MITLVPSVAQETGNPTVDTGRTVVATTYHKGQMISLTSKPQSGSIMWEFTRELDKESLLN